MSKERYNQIKMSAHDAVKLVKDGDTISVPTGAGEPPTLLTALSDRRREFKDVKLLQILPMRPFEFNDPETFENVRCVSFFLNGPNRKLVNAGYGDVIPNFFHECPKLIREGFVPVDAVFTMASAMDEFGYFSISLAADYTMAALAKAKTIVLEVNPNVPFANGNCHIHVSQVTAIVEDDAPVFSVPIPKIGEVEAKIGGYVAEMVPNGATLQIGYGSIPDAVVQQLDDKVDLGIHTEMIGDGIMSLVEKGVVTNRKKNIYRDKMFAAFALGSEKLYRFMHRNPSMEMHPVDFTNDPYLAGQNDNLISINATIEIDFTGQCNSESLNGQPFSSTGGQLDFVRAANRSKGGMSFIVLPSTAKGGTISKIVPRLSPGAHVTTGKNEIAFVVTEYGVVDMRGKSLRERAKALIELAHPKFRDELREEAAKLNYMRIS